MTEDRTALMLADALSISEARLLAAARLAELRAVEAERLSAFLVGIGVDPAVVLEGYWTGKASKALAVTIDERAVSLGDLPDGERASVIDTLRRLVPRGSLPAGHTDVDGSSERNHDRDRGRGAGMSRPRTSRAATFPSIPRGDPMNVPDDSDATSRDDRTMVVCTLLLLLCNAAFGASWLIGAIASVPTATPGAMWTIDMLAAFSIVGYAIVRNSKWAINARHPDVASGSDPSTPSAHVCQVPSVQRPSR